MDPDNPLGFLTFMGNLVYFSDPEFEQQLASHKSELEGSAGGLRLLGIAAFDDGDYASAVTYTRCFDAAYLAPTPRTSV